MSPKSISSYIYNNTEVWKFIWLETKCKAFLTIPLNSHTRILLKETEVHLIIFYDGMHFCPVSSRTAISLETLNGQKLEKRGPTGAVFKEIPTTVSSLRCPSAGYLVLLPQGVSPSFSDVCSFQMCPTHPLLPNSFIFFQCWRGHPVIFKKSWIHLGCSHIALLNLCLHLWNGDRSNFLTSTWPLREWTVRVAQVHQCYSDTNCVFLE